MLRVGFVLADFDDAHHAQILVIQDVAVVDGFADKGIEGDTHLDAAVGWHIDHILPCRLLHSRTLGFD